MAVPARFARQVEAVLAAYDAIDERIERGEPRGFGNEAFGTLQTLMADLRLDRKSHPHPVLANELTPDQRAVLVALTASRFVPVDGAASVPPWWSRRRWLGLAPPGLVEMRWPEMLPADPDAAIATLPAHERVEAGIELLLANRPLGPRFFDALPLDAVHALDYARRTLPLLPRYATTAGSPSAFAYVALFTAFSTSGELIPPGTDDRFPLSYRLPGEPLAERVSTRFLVDHLHAVVASRRDDVLAAAMRRHQGGGNYQAAVYLIERCGPLPRTSEIVMRWIEASRAKKLTGTERKAISVLAKRMNAPASPRSKKKKKKKKTTQT